MKAEEKAEDESCNPEVLRDPVQCIEAWDHRMSEELRRIGPVLEPLMRMQYPNPFMKWVEYFKIKAEKFNKKAEMKSA
jgi:hypothetical protein